MTQIGGVLRQRFAEIRAAKACGYGEFILEEPGVLLFIDNSNIFIAGQAMAERKEGPTAKPKFRLDFEHLLQVAVAGRKLLKAFVVGSIPPEEKSIWERLEAVTGVAPELYERGAGSNKEQGLDQCLQVNMLRAVSDHAEPQIAVLLTGDGSGYDDGAGFHADLERMFNAGWGIEVLSWQASCKMTLRLWAERVGVFVPLDNYYDSISFLQTRRHSTAVDLSARPVSSTRDSPKELAARQIRNEELAKQLLLEKRIQELEAKVASKADGKKKHDRRFERKKV